MSVSASSQLLHAGAMASASTPHSQSLTLSVRRTRHGRARSRSRHHVRFPLYSLRLYGFRRTAWPKTLLAAAFSIEEVRTLTLAASALQTDEHATASAENDDALYSDSKVKLFFERLSTTAQSSKQGSARQLRFPWRKSSSASRAASPDKRNRIDAADEPERLSPRTVFPLERRTELVDWRRRRRRTSRAMKKKRPRRQSSFEPREFLDNSDADDDDEDEDYEEEEEAMLSMPEAYAILDEDRLQLLTPPPGLLHAEVLEDAIKVVELDRYAAHTTDYDLSEKSTVSQPDSELNGSGRSLPPSPSVQSLQKEVAALRTENAEQRELIRRLLMENQRLQQAQARQEVQEVQDEKQETVSSPVKSTEKKSQPELQHDKPPRHNEPKLSSMAVIPMNVLQRRASLMHTVVDGEETLVDPKFDLLVQEIESDLAFLLRPDSEERIIYG